MIFRWRGNGAGTKTAWEDGRNWVNELGTAYLQAVYPGVNNDSNDDVLFDQALASGASSVAGSDESAKDIRSLRVSSAYDGSIASSGTYLQIDCEEIQIEATGASAVYIYGDTIDSATLLGGTIYLKGTIGTLTCLKGTITLDASTTISTALTTGYISSETSDVDLTIPGVTSIPTTVNCNGGTVSCAEPITTLNVTAGEWTQTAAVTTLNLSGGTCYASDGNIATANVYGGTLDCSTGMNARRIATLYGYPNSTVDLDNGQDNILISSYVQRFGGTVVFPGGYKYAPYRNDTYAGASDAIQGIAPQVINNSNVDSTEVVMGPHDRLYIYCTSGSIAAGGAVAFLAKESTAAGGSYANISGKSASFDDGDDNQTKLIEIGGWELTEGCRVVKVNAAESGVQDAYISCLIIKVEY